MNTARQECYQQLIKHLQECKTKQENSLIVTATGMGISFLIKSYIPSTAKDTLYIDTPTLSLVPKLQNIIDLPLSSNLEFIEAFFKKLNLNQKIILICSEPEVLNSQAFLKSQLRKKFYSHYYFGCRTREDNDLFCLDLNPKLTSQQLKLIYQFSGGWARISKYFSLHPEYLSNPKSDLTILDSLKTAYLGLSLKSKEKLNIVKDSKLQVGLFTNLDSESSNLDVSIYPDLSFVENGVLSKFKLTKSEYDIVNFLIGSSSVITRDKISDIRWGEGKYDSFSDQAINMLVSRLNKKLKYYLLQTVPRVGYKLVRR